MKKNSHILSLPFLLLLFSFLPANLYAQLSGTYTIPGTPFATIKAAVDSLNQVGVGAGGVTFNVIAGYTEFTLADITITATGTAGNPIVFQKSGAGVNPLVTRTDAGLLATSSLGGAGDAIFRLEGTDYITFDGIDVAATDQGIEYGYLTHKPDGTNGCQFVTIKNCVVTMTKGTSGFVMGIYIGNGTVSVSSATGVVVTAASGMNTDVTITGNTVQNVHAGIYVRGATAMPDSNVTIGQSGAGNTIQNYGGGSATSTYGVYFIYVDNPAVAYNTITSADHGATLYGIFYSSGISGDVVGSNNAFTLANIATSSATQYIYSSNAVTSNTFSNNTFAAGTISSTGTVYLIYASSATPDVTVSGNATVGTITKAGGTTYCYYNFGSPASGTETITNNNFSNITVSTGTSGLYGIYTNTASGQNRVCSNNTVSNFTHAGTGIIYCIYGLSANNNQVNDNTVSDITGGGSIYGLYMGGVNATVYNNNVYGVTSNTVTTSSVYGAYSTTGTDVTWYNNFFSDLEAPNGTSTTAATYGMYITSGTSVSLFYNTVYLDYVSTVASNQSAALYVGSTTPTTVNMNNNIFVNDVDVTVGTRAMAFRKGGTGLTNLVNLNNNLYYAGTPSATNVIFYDGTNTDQTLAEYKTRVSPLESASITENPPFVNTTTPPYNLHMNTAVATQTESGGTPVAGITVDYDGDTRNVTTPDVGADEFNGIAADFTPPSISYTPLGSTSSTSARTLTSSITDASGVPTAGIGLPVLYWKINSGSWNATTATYLSGSDYQFTFGSGVVLNDTVNYYICAQDNAVPPNVGAFPSGGAGGFTANPPAASIPPTNPSSYLIVDLPLSGSYTVGTTLFSSITGRDITFVKSVSKVMKEVVVEANAPEVIRQKGIEYADDTELSHTASGIKRMVEVEEISWIPMENGRVYEGDLFVKKAENPTLDFPEGIDGVYLTITAAIADLNLRGVGGATTFLLTDATYPTETFPLTINVLNDNIPTAVNTVTIKPNTGVTAAVSGASAASQIFKILNSYITIDGSNTGGTDRNLTIENTSTTTPQVLVIGSMGTTPITNVTVKNCNIINGVTSSSAVVVSDGTTPGTAGYFNDITIENNSIGKAYIGVYNIAVVSPGNGSGLLLSGNDLNNTTPNHISLVGIYVQGIDGATISNNNIGNYTTTYTSNVTGIWFATGTVNSTISNNTIGPINITTAAPRGIVVSSGASNANVSISGNTISSMVTSYSSATYGIYVFSTTTGVIVEKNYVNNIWNINTGGYGARGIHVNTATASSNITIQNNVVRDVQATSDVSSTYWGIGIGIEGATNGVNVYYNSVNLYGSAVGYTSATINAAFAVLTATASLLDVRDNVFVNTFDNTNSTTDKSYAVYSNAPNTAFTLINYNDYYVEGVPGILGYLGGDQTTLANWQTATGQDANSISSDPQFVSNTDLRPLDTSPLLLAATPIAGITTDFLGATRSATTPTIGAYEMPVYTPLAGDYTVGLSMFKQFSGLDITFEQRVRTIEITELIVNQEAAEQVSIYEETLEGTVTLQEPADPSALVPITVTRTVEQEYFVPMLNGSEYDGDLYYEFTPEQVKTFQLKTLGVYATITAAKDDAMLKGVSAAVRFLLVDATYLSETFPIVLNEIPGASAVNTVTLMPNTGVTSLISGSPTNTQIFAFNGVDYFIIDGRAGGVGTNNDLTIENLTTTGTSSHTIRLINGAANNVLRYVKINNNTQGTAGPRAVDFSTSASDPAGNSFNSVENCYISGGRTCVGFAGTLANPNSDNVIIGNKITDFSYAGVWLSSNTANTTIDENEIFQTVSAITSGTGIVLSTSGIINIRGNKFYDLQNTTTTSLRGISGSPSAGGTVNIINNFFSFTQDNGTKTSIYAIQISGSTEHTANIFYNSFNIGGVHTGGTAGVIVSGGLIKSNTGATSTFNAKDNISINTRTGGTSGVVHTNFFAGGTSLVGTLDIDYNAWFAFGDPGSFSAGWNGYVFNDQQAYRDSAAPHEQHTNFKDVDFVSGIDLHLEGLSLGDADLAGIPVAGITVDIDGDTRDLTYPYRGADEGNVPFLPIFSPSNLVAIPDTFTVDLSWQDNSNNEAGFIIQRKDGDSLSVNPWANIDTVNANVINYLDTGLNPNTMYTYRVFGYNALGSSGFSNMFEVTTFIPVEFTTFTAEISGREVLVTWITATELNNRGFDIERKMEGEWEKIGFKDGKGTTTEESFYSFIDKFTYESYLGTITYRLKQMDFDGTYAYSPEVEVNVDFTPKEYTLYQNYPNPFNPVTTIKYSLPFESNVRIAVYNILGEMIDVFVDETKQVGFHDYNWNASNLASGIYIYTIEAKSVAGDKNYSSVKKMILMK